MGGGREDCQYIGCHVLSECSIWRLQIYMAPPPSCVPADMAELSQSHDSHMTVTCTSAPRSSVLDAVLLFLLLLLFLILLLLIMKNCGSVTECGCKCGISELCWQDKVSHSRSQSSSNFSYRLLLLLLLLFRSPLTSPLSLMEACYHGNMDCVRLLIAAGASWGTRDSAGSDSWSGIGSIISLVCSLPPPPPTPPPPPPQGCQPSIGQLTVGSVRHWTWL